MRLTPDKRMLRLFFILGILLIQSVRAQSLISTAGGTLENNLAIANWSIGEITLDVLLSDQTSITLGLNQPLDNVTSSVESILIFPNPVNRDLNFVYDGLLPISGRIISSNDFEITSFIIDQRGFQLDFSTYAKGLYLIEIFLPSGKTKTYKIIKN